MRTGCLVLWYFFDYFYFTFSSIFVSLKESYVKSYLSLRIYLWKKKLEIVGNIFSSLKLMFMTGELIESVLKMYSSMPWTSWKQHIYNSKILFVWGIMKQNLSHYNNAILIIVLFSIFNISKFLFISKFKLWLFTKKYSAKFKFDYFFSFFFMNVIFVSSFKIIVFKKGYVYLHVIVINFTHTYIHVYIYILYFKTRHKKHISEIKFKSPISNSFLNKG